ncbi:hypothetical protein ACFYZ9_26165 [Streptomyces sp. NPDC001691]
MKERHPPSALGASAPVGLVGACLVLVCGEYAASRIRRNAPEYPAYWW